ncbi:MAG: 2-oxo acid dehydrogenase subunit E2 [Candidatus Abyssobacteria bacterium SURF_5]|uniref:Dihydrolipoamide acetyltransferase component of pyruvate dehydrogenase complex n=1 Tax=Abyssobacteria bacterium (strain SURF_5) TaxID=2093360 RepID=A0A3A4P832_ABYX5|nr:MAG: 2-oxo acid dehydrogenase subunit E2 [Candidatus Abyssubacteria bacterium SURF_5]
MAAEVIMPRLSDTMEEGRIIKWLKKVGDPVKEGELLLEVETDKADIEVEAFDTGILIEITAEEGETIKVGEKIGLIGSKEEAKGIRKPAAPAEEAHPAKPERPPRAEKAEEEEKPEESAAVEEILEEEAKAEAPEKEKAKRATEEEKRKREEEQRRKKEERKEEERYRREEEERRKEYAEEARRRAEELKEKPRRPEPAVSIHMDQRTAIDKFVARRAPGKATVSPLARELAQKHDIDLSQITGTGPGGEIVKRDIEQAVSAKAKAGPAAKIEVLRKAREVRATPLAVVLAEREGVDLEEVRGTGIDGRIRETDVKAYVARRCNERGEEFQELSLMRKTIARRMTLSKQTIPHFYLNMTIDMDAAVELRKKLNEGKKDEEKISYNDLIVKASALALEEVPEVNSTFVEEKVRVNKRINVGIATATPDGLVVPVIMDANRKSAADIAREARDKAERARKRKLRPDEYSNATFTVSNLGMFGIDHFTAIIDPGQSAILAVGALAQEPVVVDGQVRPKNLMRVTLSCDHRVVDGYVGTQFLIKLRELLEKPETLHAKS